MNQILDLSGPMALQLEPLTFLIQQQSKNTQSGKFLYRQSKNKPQQQQRVGDCAIIPIIGFLSQRGTYSGASTQQVSFELKNALADPYVKQIILEIDSFGGSAYGVQELADEIYAARSKKKIVAISNSLASSGAYWIASQASEFYVTPGGQVGGIGVYMMHQYLGDTANSAKVTLISAGKYKTETSPHEPLSKEAQQHMQNTVDQKYQVFSNAVARGRGVAVSVVKNGMGQGRTMGAQAAVKARMVDGVISMPDLVEKITSSSRYQLNRARISLASIS